MARELGEIHTTTTSSPQGTVRVQALHIPTGSKATALAHSRREAKAACYERLAQSPAVKAWMAEDA